MYKSISIHVYNEDRVDVRRTVFTVSETPVTVEIDGMLVFMELDKAEELADKLQQLVQDIKMTKKEATA